MSASDPARPSRSRGGTWLPQGRYAPGRAPTTKVRRAGTGLHHHSDGDDFLIDPMLGKAVSPEGKRSPGWPCWSASDDRASPRRELECTVVARGVNAVGSQYELADRPRQGPRGRRQVRGYSDRVSSRPRQHIAVDVEELLCAGCEVTDPPPECDQLSGTTRAWNPGRPVAPRPIARLRRWATMVRHRAR